MSSERPLSVFTGNAHPALARAVCDYLGIPLGRANVFQFSNQNIFVQIHQSVREEDVFVLQPLCPGRMADGRRTTVSDSIMELLIMLDALKRASAGRITAVIPYYAYARTDKKDQPRVPITARLLADLIQTAGANRVLTVDLHAGQVQGFFDVPVDELSAISLLCEYFRGRGLADAVVVSADVGFAKRARNFAELLAAPLAIIEKRRVGNDGRAEQISLIGDVRDRVAIVVDDEVDTAGSLCGAVEVVVRHGARAVYATCVHAVLSGRALERIEAAPLRELVTTDTLPFDEDRRSDKVKVLSVANLLGEAIHRIHTGGSVGALFSGWYGVPAGA